MTLSGESALDRVKMNHRAKYLLKEGFRFKVIVGHTLCLVSKKDTTQPPAIISTIVVRFQ